MTHFLFGLILFAIAITANAQEGLSGVLATDEQKAETYLKAEQWAELAEHTKQWADTDIGNWLPWYYRGRVLAKQNDTQGAVEAFSQALKLSPPDDIDADLQIWLADTYVVLQNFPAAEVGYRRLLEVNENSPVLWDKLRAALAEQAGDDKRQQELAVLEQLLIYGNYINNYDLWKRQAQLFELFENKARARVAYKNMLRLMPKDLQAAEWAFKYDLENSDATAFEASRKHLLILNNKHPMVNVYLGDKALADDNKRLARVYYKLASTDPHYRYEQARALTALAELNSSRNSGTILGQYVQAIKADASYLPAWQGAIVALRKLREYKKASLYTSRMLRVKRAVEENKPIPPEVLAGL